MKAVNELHVASAADFLPSQRSILALRKAAVHCEGCDLFRRGTQTVFGEGPPKARLMLIGETPGDQEDLAGHPFVGAAGRLLDETLAAVGIDRKRTYVTNAVKHFKWTPRGKRRLHGKPSSREIGACRPWLDAELEAISPQIIVCLGATAAQALLGKTFRVTRQRGELITDATGHNILATFHPSAILRAPEASRKVMREQFVSDLRIAAQWLAKRAAR
jgi:uracil-DNA glycosylase family protein